MEDSTVSYIEFSELTEKDQDDSSEELAASNSLENEIVAGLPSMFTSALDYKNTVLLHLLLERGADPSQKVFVVPPPQKKGILGRWKSKRVMPANTYPLTLYCASGNVEAVRILLADKRVDPTLDDSVAFRQAYFSRRVSVVRLLLEDGRSDPLADKGRVVNNALQSGAVDMLALLMNDQRVILRRKEVTNTICYNI